MAHTCNFTLRSEEIHKMRQEYIYLTDVCCAIAGRRYSLCCSNFLLLVN